VTITPGPGIACRWVNLTAAGPGQSWEQTLGTPLGFIEAFAALARVLCSLQRSGRRLEGTVPSTALASRQDHAAPGTGTAASGLSYPILGQ